MLHIVDVYVQIVVGYMRHLTVAESEKPCQRVSNADRKVFANPESFWNMLIIGWRISR